MDSMLVNTPAMGTWGSIPVELHLMILKALTDELQATGASLNPYAGVCFEWREFIDTVAIHQIQITPRRLKAPGYADWIKRMGNRGPVRKVHILAPLVGADCRTCKGAERDNYGAIHRLACDTMYFAFNVLSTWKPSKDVSLSISLRATKSSPYHVAGCCRAVHDEPRQQPVSGPENPWTARARRGPTGWLRRCEMPDLSYPQVTAVTSLELCRAKGIWWGGVAVQRLLQLLPRIRDLRCGAMSHWSEQSTRRFIKQIGTSPADISRLVLFGDYSDGTFFPLLKESRGSQVENLPPRPTPNSSTGRALAQIGAVFPKLEHLSASFVIEGTDVLRAMYTLCTPPHATPATNSWKTLVSLTLTSGTLIPGRSNYAKINSLLRCAAATASALPALQRLELWNGAESMACAFRYLGASLAGGPDRVAHLSWYATWSFQLERSVVDSWGQLAASRRARGLLVTQRQLRTRVRREIKCREDALYCLDFHHDVLDAGTL